MAWLTERPIKTGKYWVKQHQHKRVVSVWRGGNSDLLCTNEDGGASLEDPMYDGALWWSEPLVEPE